MPEEARKPTSRQADRGRALFWLAAALPGVALVSVALMTFILFGVLDAIHYVSIRDFFTPDPVAAGGVLGLVGGAEGVTLSIVIVAVVFGIQNTSSRYSPRIIGIFTRNPLNALVLSFALASILYTFLVRTEVKSSYVPMWSVGVAEVLALINFAILLPYVGYIFEVMRAETLVESIMRRAKRELKAATSSRHPRKHRDALMESIAQVTDIAYGSIQLGDMPVCVLTIEVLGRFLADDYLKIRKSCAPEWFQVGHADMPGASDQIVAEVNRAQTWFAYTIMSSFVDMVGLTPVHRKEAVHAIAVATRDAGIAAIEEGDSEVAELCLEARARDPQVSLKLARLLVRNLLDLTPNARPIGLNGMFKGVAKLTFWAMAADQRDIARVLVEGIAAAPPDFVDAALDRMESMQNGLFWEVNERVIAFDWVDESLRAEIPRLRAALRRSKGSIESLAVELEKAPTVHDLVPPEPNAAPAAPAAAAAAKSEPSGC